MEWLVMDMNERVKNGQSRKTLVIFDEFADAVAQSRKGKQLDVFKTFTSLTKTGAPKVEKVYSHTLKSLEENLKILLQKGRSSGFRILAATQRASVQVITGDAKVNFPVQVCFRVPKAVDSSVVIGEPGAESLTDKGDGLMKSPQYNDIVRFQGYTN
jgi:S-DNA-T family DNA segregation ATPase FtsK/SpoIIIE